MRIKHLGSITAALVLVGIAGAVPASAERTTGWAGWDDLTGSANAYTTSVQVPIKGFPTADVVSDSRAGSVGVQTGASVWHGPGTPPGAKYGSSQGEEYLNLRPRADRADQPSTTTYTFDTPTPPTGWTFVLGDIDADAVRVEAKNSSGAPVDVAELGFVSTFNLCDTTPRPGGCSASIGDQPTWDPLTQTLTGNPDAADTFGAAAWFEPTVSLSTLTLTFTRRSGFPVYQTWFAGVARTISGTVDDVSAVGACDVEDVVLRLVGPSGESLETTSPGPDGTYSFGQYATQPGYVVSAEPPATCAVVGPRSVSVSTAGSDAVADFEVREIIPQPVSGVVRDADDDPVAGVTVTLTAPGGGTRTTTTAADGSYLFDDNAVADGYVTSVEAPGGYTAVDDTNDPFDVDATPITGQDFVLTANPDVSGTVTGGGAGVGGVTVTLTSGAQTFTTLTAGDGTYTFTRVPAGQYDITIDTPAGYSPAPSRDDVDVAAADVDDQDFALQRDGALGGRITVDGTDPAPGVDIRVDGPSGPRDLTTDDDGSYFLGDLEPGVYVVDVEVPDGFTAVGPSTQTVTITAAGEIFGALDVDLEAADVVEPTPTPPPPGDGPGDPGAPGVGSGGSGATDGSALPDTGASSPAPLVAGVLALLLGMVLVAAGRTPRRR